ncbi:MAG: glycosyltransferase [Planctomycetales bacterium]
MPRTVIVVPCYNEAERLDFAQYLQAVACDPRTDFLFVNDGSRDDTLERLQSLAAERPGRIAWCDLPENCGKAEAVRRGVCAALRSRPEYVGFWDADLATPLDEVPRFRAVLDRRPELQMVIGTRARLLGRRIVRKRSRSLLGRLFAQVASRAIGLPLFDTQCGAKLFRANDETERLFAEPFLSRWIFDVELFARLVSGRRALEPPSLSGRGRGRVEAHSNSSSSDRLVHTSNESTPPSPCPLPQREGSAACEAIFELPLERWHDVAGSKLKTRDFVRAIGELAAIRWRYFGRSPQPTWTDRPHPSGARRALLDPRPREERQAA